MLHVSRMSGRVMVEPFYEFGKRNWTWYELAGGNAVSDVQIQQKEGEEGYVQDPIGVSHSNIFFRKIISPFLQENILI